MALVKATLSAGIKTLVEHSGGNTTQQFADGMADLIDAYIKTGTVTVPALGLISAAPGSPVTGAAVGVIS